MEVINEYIVDFLNYLGVWSPIFACLLISVESILPFMPLAVFITLNFIYFGHILGFLISLIFTILGCMMSFYIFRKGFNSKFNKLIENRTKMENMMRRVDNLTLGQLVIILAIPFTPAFMVNIAAGLSNINEKKYFTALIFGKISLVYFWGYVGTSLLDSITNPLILIKITIVILLMYVISKIVNKKLDI